MSNSLDLRELMYLILTQHPARIKNCFPNNLRNLTVLIHIESIILAPDRAQLWHFIKNTVDSNSLMRSVTGWSYTASSLVYFRGNTDNKSLFYRAFEGMNPSLALQNEYIFNSAFESGNLDCVIKVRPNQFDLFLRVDSNTRGHTQWYFFSIKNPQSLLNKNHNVPSQEKNQKSYGEVKLNICNLRKKSNLISQGMKPFIFSRRGFRQKGKNWQQGGENVKYQQCPLRYEVAYQRAEVGTLFSLSFTYEFQYPNDEVFFAYCIPYTYQQLQKDIQVYQQSKYVKTQVLGKSLSGLDIHVLQITRFQNVEKQKQNIVITARIHPGESNGSHLLKGIVQFLLKQSKQSENIRQNSTIYIIPMLNPDGVVLGNSRTGVAGRDLNRQFNVTKKDLFPEVYLVKSFVNRLQKLQGVLMFLDLHGHSRKKNTFIYGPNYPLSHSQYIKCRVLPKLIEKINPSFRFYSCSFTISDEKKSTARAVMLQSLGVPFSYTVQSSVGLFYSQELMKTLNFTELLWIGMGQTVIKGVDMFLSALIEHQSLFKQRKNQLRSKNMLASKFLKKVQEQVLEIQQGKLKKASLLELIEQVKTSSPKKFEQESDSDEHDANEQLLEYNTQTFNKQLVKKKHQNNKIPEKVQEEFFNYSPHKMTVNQGQQSNYALHQDISKSTSKLFVQQERNTFTRLNNRQNTPGQKKIFECLSKKKLSYSLKKKQTETIEKTPKKSTIESKLSRQRYSLASNSVFPIEDRCEIVSLPKGLETIKRQLKKGRNLIKNLEQSKLKFVNLGAKLQQNVIKHERPKLNHPDFSRLRIGSSAGQFSRVGGVGGSLNWDYSPFNGYEMDNLAMTITTFRKR